MRQLILLLMLIITSAVYAYEPYITEDKVWEYYEESDNNDDAYYALEKYKFEGTDVYGGIEYHKLKCVFRSVWNTFFNKHGDFDHGSWEGAVDEIVALLREDDGKVYLLRFDKIDDSLNEAGELLLFDFNLNSGDSIFGEIIENYHDGHFFNLVPSSILCVEKSNNSENNRAVYKLLLNYIYECYYSSYEHWKDYYDNETDGFAIATVVEGVGNTGYGTMFYLDCAPYLYPTCNCWSECYFNNLYDLEGNVIYPGKGTKNPFSGVRDVSTDSPRHDGKMYDLNGREIRNPLPGTVYIRDGRKAVAR